MIKLLIVDDSALMRRLIRQVFEEEGNFEIRTARNGIEAIELNREFKPDVITLDINMPEMDGLTALSYIMAERPVPVIMVSSLTEKGALATFEALNLGAVDYVTKPGGTVSLSVESIKKELISKVYAAVKANIKRRNSIRERIERKIKVIKEKRKDFLKRTEKGIVIIGVSTGGPSTLEKILPFLPKEFPWPVIVVQHMPEAFTGPFAERMDKLCQLSVQEVRRPTFVESGNIYIARGGADCVIKKREGRIMLIPKPEDPKFLWHPSVDALGYSVIENLDCRTVIGVLLTGMGYDGADSFSEIKKRGGRTIAESEESAVVFGMPQELIKRGGATVVLPAEKISERLITWVM